MFEGAFKKIQEILWKEEKCNSELDYTEQTSWILFLKYLEDFESTAQTKAELEGKEYTPLIDDQFRWSTWAAPKNDQGQIDASNALIGDDLIEFIDGDLFPYLKNLHRNVDSNRGMEQKISGMFDELSNKVTNGYAFRDIAELVDTLKFQTDHDKHELSELYESKIKAMGNAGRNGGEYYTPRALIRTIIKVINPALGETIYDGAVGSAGFLCEAYNFLLEQKPDSEQYERLQKETLYGQEKKSLAYIIGMMNMMLHGVETPNIVHGNTLSKNLADVQPSDRYDVILANPPFGARENKQIQENFNIKSGETAYLFLQHFIKHLKPGGRAAVVIKNTFLSNDDNASRQLRKDLLDTCNLHTILDCPSGVFAGAGVKTVTLFFEKGSSTHSIWYYQLDPGRNLGKTTPLNDGDLSEFLELSQEKPETPKSWCVDIKDVSEETWDLSVSNPNVEDTSEKRTPSEILAEIEALDNEAAEAMAAIKELL